ncbi:Disease resistance protein RPM1 [Hordeum vulgare]|nr:Disease resistance protein RPM1 [Hordeum vulgare]
MADLSIGLAHGAVDSLLGRLTRLIEDEARLLRGVHSDIQYIKDEMESVYGFLLNFVEGDDCTDRQMEVWTKQVAAGSTPARHKDQGAQSKGSRERNGSTAQDEAEHCFDVLLAKDLFFAGTSVLQERSRAAKVLDLEDFDGLKDHHVDNICEIFQLRYLNLRRTKITKLPKKIEYLQQLETLDIRETAVRSFATKAVVLPMLKNMLAGCTQHPNEDIESFSTVCMPRGIDKATNLQILCHVDVSGKEDRLTEIGSYCSLES